MSPFLLSSPLLSLSPLSPGPCHFVSQHLCLSLRTSLHLSLSAFLFCLPFLSLCRSLCLRLTGCLCLAFLSLSFSHISASFSACVSLVSSLSLTLSSPPPRPPPVTHLSFLVPGMHVDLDVYAIHLGHTSTIIDLEMPATFLPWWRGTRQVPIPSGGRVVTYRGGGSPGTDILCADKDPQSPAGVPR